MKLVNYDGSHAYPYTKAYFEFRTQTVLKNLGIPNSSSHYNKMFDEILELRLSLPNWQQIEKIMKKRMEFINGD